jgi:mannose-6-phosphate isomerase
MEISGSDSPSGWAPFRIAPNYSKRVWGYRDLRPWFDYSGAEPVGEAWLSGDECEVSTGPHSGRLLGALFKESPEELLGAGVPTSGSPLLIKVIFAREKLSVQVHPDDRMAQKYGEPRGKTECWYALEAGPEAKVALGLKPGVTLDEVRAGIHAGTLESDLNLVSVSAGDVIFVDAGTVHAIWPGAVLLEVQQNSDLTYRMYDYGRPRELHIDKALEATRIETRAGKVAPTVLPDRTVLIDEKYFRMERVWVTGRISGDRLADGRKSAMPPPGLSYLFAAAGAGRITGPGFDPVGLPSRSIACVPAAATEFAVEDLGGLDLIRITPQWAGQA